MEIPLKQQIHELTTYETGLLTRALITREKRCEEFAKEPLLASLNENYEREQIACAILRERLNAAGMVVFGHEADVSLAYSGRLHEAARELGLILAEIVEPAEDVDIAYVRRKIREVIKDLQS